MHVRVCDVCVCLSVWCACVSVCGVRVCDVCVCLCGVRMCDVCLSVWCVCVCVCAHEVYTYIGELFEQPTVHAVIIPQSPCSTLCIYTVDAH